MSGKTDRQRRAREQQERAERAIAAIMSGEGELTEEALTLSNEFTDGLVRRIVARTQRPEK